MTADTVRRATRRGLAPSRAGKAVDLAPDRTSAGSASIRAPEDQALSELALFLGADFCALIERVPPEGNALHLRASTGFEPGSECGSVVAEHDSAELQAFRTRSTVVVRDTAKRGRFAAQSFVPGEAIVSGISVPLVDDDHVPAVLGVYSAGRRRFSRSQIDVVQRVAHGLARAYRRGRGRPRSEDIEPPLQQRLQLARKWLNLVESVAAITLEPISSKQAYQAALDAICTQIDCSEARVYVRSDREPDQFMDEGACWSRGEGGKRASHGCGHPCPPAEKDLVAAVFGTGRAEWAPGGGEPLSAPETDRPAPVASRFASPVVVKKCVVAVLDFHGSWDEAPDAEFFRTMEVVGIQLGQVVQRERSEAYYRGVVEDQTELICRFRPDGCFTFTNDAFRRFFGRRSEDLEGSNFIEELPDSERGMLQRFLCTFGPKRAVQRYEHQAVRCDGSISWLQWTLRAFHGGDGRLLVFQAVGRDITDQKLTEGALRHSEKELRFVTAQLIRAKEEEQRRLSRELHDGLGQKLAMLEVEVETLEHSIAPSAPVRQSLGLLRGRIATVSDEVRNLAHRLHPSILDDLGLTDALQAYVQEFEKLEGIHVIFATHGMCERLDSGVATCLFRAAQEALRNVAKHSGSELVRLRLRRTNEAVVLSVRDFGRGFGNEPAESKQRKGLGLVSIQERARLVGGKSTIRSIPMEGTLVRVRVPLNGSREP